MTSNLKRLRTLRSALGLSAAAVVVSSAAFAGAAGATGSWQVTPVAAANTIIIGGGSSTTYNMMQALDSLYSAAPGCTMVVDFVKTAHGVSSYGSSATTGNSVNPALDYHCLSAKEAADGHNLQATIINPVTGAIVSNGLVDAQGTTIQVVNPFNDAVVELAPLGSSMGIFQLETNANTAGGLNKKYDTVVETTNITGAVVTSGSTSVTAATGTTFASTIPVGAVLTGAGIAANTTVVSATTSTITLSNAATATGATTGITLTYPNTITAVVTSGSTTVTPKTGTFRTIPVGAVLAGNGIASATSVTAEASDGSSITLSQPAIATTTATVGDTLTYTTTGDVGNQINVTSNTDFIRSSRVSSSAALGSQTAATSGDAKGLTFVSYAYDGVSWVHYSAVNGKATHSDLNYTATTKTDVQSQLTMDDLAAIYAGNITNWSQVGGADAPILVFSAQEGSGTQSTWKTYVGKNSTDPSNLGTKVNCFNKTGQTYHTGYANAQSASVLTTNCAGPFDIFENEQGSISLNSLPTSYTNPSLNFAGITTTPVAATATVAAYNKYTELSSNSVTQASTPAASAFTAPADCGLWVFGCTAGSINKSATKNGAGAYTYTLTYNFTVPTNSEVKSDAIFFYSAGLYAHQCALSIASQPKNKPAVCASGNMLDTTGKIDFQLGQIGGVDTNTVVNGVTTGVTDVNTSCITINATVTTNPCLASQASILSQEFQVWRPVMNVYSNGTNANIPAARPAALAYVSETGFVCSPRTLDQENPQTGNSYRADLNAAITASGFFPISGGMTSGVVNFSPLAEGASATSTGAGNGSAAVIAAGTKYAPYLGLTNSDGSAVVAATSTGLVNSTGSVVPGYAGTASNPNGFCLQSNTNDSTTN